MLTNFPIIKLTTIKNEEVREQQVFEMEKKEGYEQVFIDGSESIITKTEGVSNDEYESLIRYLVVNDLQLFYSKEEINNSRSGFVIRKKHRHEY